MEELEKNDNLSLLIVSNNIYFKIIKIHSVSIVAWDN